MIVIKSNQNSLKITQRFTLIFFSSDFTSIKSFHQDDVKFTSPSFYNLTPPPPPMSRPPPYDVQTFTTTPTKSLPATVCSTGVPSNSTSSNLSSLILPQAENYYAATDIVKVC